MRALDTHEYTWMDTIKATRARARACMRWVGRGGRGGGGDSTHLRAEVNHGKSQGCAVHEAGCTSWRVMVDAAVEPKVHAQKQQHRRDLGRVGDDNAAVVCAGAGRPARRLRALLVVVQAPP